MQWSTIMSFRAETLIMLFDDGCTYFKRDRFHDINKRIRCLKENKEKSKQVKIRFAYSYIANKMLPKIIST